MDDLALPQLLAAWLPGEFLKIDNIEGLDKYEEVRSYVQCTCENLVGYFRFIDLSNLLSKDRIDQFDSELWRSPQLVIISFLNFNISWILYCHTVPKSSARRRDIRNSEKSKIPETRSMIVYSTQMISYKRNMNLLGVGVDIEVKCIQFISKK